MKKALEQGSGSRYSHNRIRMVLLGCLVVLLLFSGCQSIPPAVIGSDTRAGLDDLAGKQTESAITTEKLIASTGEVSEGLGRLAEKAPVALRPEIAAISGNQTESVRLTVTLAGQLKEERKVTASLKESAGLDAAETAKIAAAKDRAEKGELKAKNQRNIACGISGILILLIGISVFLKIRRFW